MKKSYSCPSLKVIDFSVATHLLTASAGDRFEVEMSDDPMKGADALSDEKDVWGNGDFWK